MCRNSGIGTKMSDHNKEVAALNMTVPIMYVQIVCMYPKLHAHMHTCTDQVSRGSLCTHVQVLFPMSIDLN